MTQQTINVGTIANDGTGDPLRTAFQKTQANFSDLYAGTGLPTITNAMLATVPSKTIKGNNTTGTAVPSDLTVTQGRLLLYISSNDPIAVSFCGGV